MELACASSAACAIAPEELATAWIVNEIGMRAVFQNRGVKDKAEFGLILPFGAPLRLSHFAHYLRTLRQHYFVIRLHLLRDFRNHFVAWPGFFSIDGLEQFGLHRSSRRHRRGYALGYLAELCARQAVESKVTARNETAFRFMRTSL